MLRKDIFFVDAREMARQHPGTFKVPFPSETDRLRPGDLVKVCVNDVERIWVRVEEVKGETILGRVNNEPLMEGLESEDLVAFEKRHVYDIWE